MNDSEDTRTVLIERRDVPSYLSWLRDNGYEPIRTEPKRNEFHVRVTFKTERRGCQHCGSLPADCAC